jgi:subtilisin family serine protease
VEDDGAGSTINQFQTNSATIQGHPSAIGALAVGAAFFLSTPGCGTTPPTLEPFSSAGGDPTLFDASGARLPAPVYRQKPDLVGPDGGNDTFLGFTLASVPIADDSSIAGCKNDGRFPNFFGTSAAAPHVASVAALLLQADPSLTPTQIYTNFRGSTLIMGGAAGYNTASGFGFFQADLAANAIPAIVPAAPTLSLSAGSIMVGGSSTLTWSSANNQGCTAGGGSTGWSGAVASSGTQTFTPTAAGTNTYTMFCTNVAGASPTTSVTLTVTAAGSSGSHGGGAVGLYTLIGLTGLSAVRARRALRAARQKRAA